MKLKVTYRGFKAVDATLARLARGAPLIARASVGTGLSVLSAAAKAAAPGSIKNEIGWHIETIGNETHGWAGFMQFPRPGDGPRGPHGVYLDQGTKFIRAWHFVGQALAAALPRARKAASNAAYRAAKKISAGK